MSYNRTRQAFIADEMRRLVDPDRLVEVKHATPEALAAHDAFWGLDARSDDDKLRFLMHRAPAQNEVAT